jgi:hypothetical protein
MSRSRVVGGLLVAAAFVVLLVGVDKPFAVWNFLGFLGCLVPGGLLLLGTAKLPRTVGPAATPRTAPPESDAPPLTCRPPGGRLGMWLAAAVSWALVGLGLLLLVAGPGSLHAAPADVVVLAGLPMTAGVLLLAYLQRHRQVQFVADRDGLHARGYWRRVDAAWGDVEALCARETWAFGAQGTIYTVRTLRGDVSFFSTWPDAGQLAESVAMRSGLSWSAE